MLKRGVKEVRDNFTQYLNKIKRGEEVLITHRGNPVALIRPVPEGDTLQGKLEIASIEGLIRISQKEENISVHKKVKLTGKSLTDIILDEREATW